MASDVALPVEEQPFHAIGIARSVDRLPWRQVGANRTVRTIGTLGHGAGSCIGEVERPWRPRSGPTPLQDRRYNRSVRLWSTSHPSPALVAGTRRLRSPSQKRLRPGRLPAVNRGVVVPRCPVYPPTKLHDIRFILARVPGRRTRRGTYPSACFVETQGGGLMPAQGGGYERPAGPPPNPLRPGPPPPRRSSAASAAFTGTTSWPPVRTGTSRPVGS